MRGVVVLAALTVAVGAVYVTVVPAGLPYDEPSHWQTVVYYETHHRMPVLGDPGVSYEAQQGPLAYAVDAVVVAAARAIGASWQSAFYAVRALGILELAAASALVFLIVRRLVPDVAAAFVACVVFAANPMLLTMSGSVQNDTLALLLGLATLEAGLRWLRVPTVLVAAAIGVTAGLAVLAKLTSWVVVPAVVVFLGAQRRPDWQKAVAAFLAAAAATCGWWFARNVILYGDLTGAGAVNRTGVSFPRDHFRTHSVARVVESAITYLWVPTEYLRNTISASAPVKAAVVAVTVGLLAAGIAARRRTRVGVLVATAAGLAIATWLVIHFAYQAVAARFAYMAFPLWLATVAAACLFRRRPGFVVIAATVVFLNVWTIEKVRHVHLRPLIVFASVRDSDEGRIVAAARVSSGVDASGRSEFGREDLYW